MKYWIQPTKELNYFKLIADPTTYFFMQKGDSGGVSVRHGRITTTTGFGKG